MDDAARDQLARRYTLQPGHAEVLLDGGSRSSAFRSCGATSPPTP
ncbi:hypothetical protein [Streptomyces scabichelini]|nr:hypothetical protein [Streptomyces scabichelini]